jgi:RNA polymerase sigma-70 factor (ECF subfamily)
VTESLDFPRTYARLLPPIRAKCRRLLGHSAAAEDVAQEVFLRFWQWGEEQGIPTDVRVVMAWLYRTSTRLAIDALRARRRTGDTEVPAEALPCAIDLDSHLVARRAVAWLASSVPEEELAAAVLCRVDGVTQPEAATVLGVSERTVRRLLERFDERIEGLRKEFSA